MNNYQKGRAKEYRICEKLRQEGFDIVQRSAGSHSPVDIFAFHREKRLIKLIQAKPKSMSNNKKMQICEENGWLNDEFICEFEVL